MTSSSSAKPVRLTFKPVTKATQADFETLFESPGGPSYCWCMPYRVTPEEAKAGRGSERKPFMLARNEGFELANADVTIICERPKIGPLRGEMRARIAEIMAVDVDRISVKATTTEMLGFTGRGEGIAAQATATLEKS